MFSSSRTVAARVLALLLVGGVLAASSVRAQPVPDVNNLPEALRKVGKSYASQYTQPVTDALGADLNAGLFRTAEVGGGGLIPVVDVYVGVSVPGALTAGTPQSFQPEDEQLDDGLSIDYRKDRVPTAFGNTDLNPGQADIKLNGQTIETVPLPPALTGTPIAPLAIPQVGVGTLFGTDVQVRYLPETAYRDVGSIGLTGVAVRHSISQYIPLSPVSIAVQGSWQSLTLSDPETQVLEASGWAVNAQVSKTLPLFPLTFYGGLQYEQFGVDVEYTFDNFSGPAGPNEVTFAFSQDASTNVRALAGVSLTLALIRFNVDYAVGATNTVSAGVGVVL